MRSSDWSSDVCSADLHRDDGDDGPDQPEHALLGLVAHAVDGEVLEVPGADGGGGGLDAGAGAAAGDALPALPEVLAEEHQAEGDDHQVVAAEPQREGPDDGADHEADRKSTRLNSSH